MKKSTKLYNLIFPIWFLLFFPPVIFLTIAGNYIIDSLVLVICFSIYKIARVGLNLKSFYKQSILKVWGYGFLSDIIGASILFVLGLLGERLGLSYELTSAICYDPFSKPLAVIIILGATLVSAAFIFLFNYKYSFKNLIEDKTLRFKIALTIAIVTAPWTFLLPTKWFYY